MFCPSCKKNTETKRDNFSYLLAFLLAFTCIGLIIYILYHLDKKPNLCIYCETVCEPRKLDDNQSNSDPQLQAISSKSLEFKSPQPEKLKINYCHNCGTEIDEREELNYCGLCGDNV